MSAANNNDKSPDKPIYRCGAFKWLNRDETECVLCSKPNAPKILKTVKNSMSTVLNHLKLHKEEQKKYEELTATDQPKITQFALVRPTCKCKSHECLKGQQHYRDFVLPKAHMYAMARIRNEHKSIQWLSFTCDGWSGPNNSFFGLTAHGITSKWDRKRYVLAVREFPGKHTAAAVRDLVKSLLREWGIDESRVHCILHDQGSDVDTAFADDDIEDMDCAAHKINLICRNGIWPNPKKGEQPTPVSDLLTRCREIVGHFRRSNQAFELLTEYQGLHDLKQKHLIQDVCTRWDSTYLMIRRIIQMRAALDTYCVNQRRRDLLLSDLDWEILDELNGLLATFAEFSKMVCSDSAPLGVQLAAYKAFKAELQSYAGAHLMLEVEKMSKINEDKFGFAVQYKNIAVAAALDPRYKDSLVSGREAVEFRRNVEECISDHLDEEEIDSGALERDLRVSPPAKRPSLMEKIRAKITQGPSRLSSSSSQPAVRSDFRNELMKFFGEPILEWEVTKECDPVTWWSKNAARFPLIAPVARRFLGAPASSAASEQTFSVAKAVYDPRRSKLSPGKAEALILLNRNLPLIHYKY